MHTMEYFSVIKMNKVLIYSMIWTSHKNMNRVTERSHLFNDLTYRLFRMDKSLENKWRILLAIGW